MARRAMHLKLVAQDRLLGPLPLEEIHKCVSLP